jgi:hypothetical protein
MVGRREKGNLPAASSDIASLRCMEGPGREGAPGTDRAAGSVTPENEEARDGTRAPEQLSDFDSKNPTAQPSGEQRRVQVVAARISAAPQSCQKTLREAFSGSASPRAAIRAQCLVCTGYDREAIRNCTGHSCPLWMYRPFSGSPTTDDRKGGGPGPYAAHDSTSCPDLQPV